MTDWELCAQTYHPEARRRHADEQADRHNIFRRDGFQMLGALVADDVASIMERVACSTIKKTGALDFVDFEEILRIDALRTIAQHPDIVRVAAMHIGATPKIIDVSLWRSNVPPPDAEPDGAQGWHRDVDDWRACKLFVYLTDVGPEDGPHQFVPGSHRAEYFEVRGMAPDKYFYGAGRQPGVAEVVDGLPRFEITGRAGTTFMANTYCFHRGKVPTRNARVVFQVCYGLMALETMMTGSKIPLIRAAWGES